MRRIEDSSFTTLLDPRDIEGKVASGTIEQWDSRRIKVLMTENNWDKKNRPCSFNGVLRRLRIFVSVEVNYQYRDAVVRATKESWGYPQPPKRRLVKRKKRSAYNKYSVMGGKHARWMHDACKKDQYGIWIWMICYTMYVQRGGTSRPPHDMTEVDKLGGWGCAIEIHVCDGCEVRCW
jgi:hypothetical protein